MRSRDDRFRRWLYSGAPPFGRRRASYRMWDVVGMLTVFFVVTGGIIFGLFGTTLSEGGPLSVALLIVLLPVAAIAGVVVAVWFNAWTKKTFDRPRR